MSETVKIQTMYRHRFVQSGLERRVRVWRTLCADFFNPLIGSGLDVIDLACGYGEFINAVSARQKTAVDLNPDAATHLAPGIRFLNCSALNLPLQDQSQDVAFASNFLEHLRDKDELSALFGEVHRILRKGGRFIVLGPNIKYAYAEYWDFFDHHLALSHLSLAEGLAASGFTVIRIIPRFLPFTMAGRAPAADWIIKAYLRIPPAWRVFGKQFLVVARQGDQL